MRVIAGRAATPAQIYQLRERLMLATPHVVVDVGAGDPKSRRTTARVPVIPPNFTRVELAFVHTNV